MMEFLLQELEKQYPNRAFITAKELADFLACDIKVIYNWNKRTNPKRRPPYLSVGKEVRFPKRELVKWLSIEQGHEI